MIGTMDGVDRAWVIEQVNTDAKWFETTSVDELVAKGGLSPTLVHLIRALAGRDTAKVQQILEAMTDTASPDAVTIGWLRRLWEKARADVVGPTEAAAGDAIIALYGQSLRGQPATRAEWRAARNGFPAISDPIAAAAASIVEAVAWDPIASPDAIGDVVYGWYDLARVRAETEIGWDAADTLAAEKYEAARLDYANAQAGELPSKDDRSDAAKAEMEANAARFRAAWKQYGIDHPFEKLERREPVVNAAYDVAGTVALEALLAEARMGQPDAATAG